jgi:hypothetical protein
MGQCDPRSGVFFFTTPIPPLLSDKSLGLGYAYVELRKRLGDAPHGAGGEELKPALDHADNSIGDI